jgi:hypothetical protein
VNFAKQPDLDAARKPKLTLFTLLKINALVTSLKDCAV